MSISLQPDGTYAVPNKLFRNDIAFREQFEDAFGDECLTFRTPVAAEGTWIGGSAIERVEGNFAPLQIPRERLILALDSDQEFPAIGLDEFADRADQPFGGIGEEPDGMHDLE